MEEEFYSDHIRINISKLAYKIIQQDLIIFSFTEKLTFNGFINNLLTLYIINACESYSISPNLIKVKGDSYELRFNKIAMDEYNQSLSFLNKNFTFNKSTQFFKGILESYARLPFAKRELVLFQDKIDDIHKAIENKKMVIIKTYHTTFDLTPYKIVEAKEGTFSYLIGFDEEDNLKAVRLSQIYSIKLHGKSKHLKENAIINADELIAEYSPTFIDEPIEDIVIQFLNKKAKQSYEYSIIHRPIHSKIIDSEKNIYLFKCSLKQAEYFFFRFAGDIKIIKPETFRKKIVDMYQRGIDVNK